MLGPRPDDLGRTLEPDLRTRLERGDHEAVAAELALAGRAREAGWVLEQIWSFAPATEHYLAARAWFDALRVAIEDRRAETLDRVVDAIADQPEFVAPAAEYMQARGRSEAAARLLELAQAAPERQAEARLRAGDHLGAARLLADAGHARRALAALGPVDLAHGSAEAHALAARLRWDLGDAEGTARHAQAARRAGAGGELAPAVRNLLARALASLGHDLAGQLVLGERGGEGDQPSELAPHGRYRVTGTLPAPYAGAAYVGVDRVTLQEVELHLLLAEHAEHDRPTEEVQQALERFASLALAADAIGHPAIRPLLRLEASEGLMVFPRREGPLLRSLIRPPGLEHASPRARSLVAFMLDGLAAAHARGLVHGSLLPSQIVCDALGRPLLGAFGASALAGLVATRTGGLDEVLAVTPPEQRSGSPPTTAGDVYMIGALWAALLCGRFVDGADDLPALERSENALLCAMLARDPGARPGAREASQALQIPIEDLSELARGGGPAPEESVRGLAIDPRLGTTLTVMASEAWSDALLEALCLCRNPWLQSILDREGRALHLAAWPEGCRTLTPDPSWRGSIEPDALEFLDPAGEPNERGELQAGESGIDLRAHVVRLIDLAISRAAAPLVLTPAGEIMLALDVLLTLEPTS